MCLNPITIKNPSNPRRGMTVPCGVCLECKRKYQNSWMIRIEQELKSFNYKGVFFTLTYADEAIPKNYLYQGHIYRTAPDYRYDKNYDIVDIETGELIDVSKSIDFNKFKSHELKQFYSDCKSGYYDNDVVKFNSVRKKDIQEWNNRCRKSYRNATGNTVKYFITSEYGPRTMRPHYHGVMLGINYQDFKRYFAKDWFNHFGREGCEAQCVLVEDIDPQRGGIEYVTKYCSKGIFEHPFCSKNFFYYYKKAGETVFSEYHSKHYERCIEYFNIDEPIVDPADKLISLGMGKDFIQYAKDNHYYDDVLNADLDDVITYDLTLLDDEAVDFLGIRNCKSNDKGELVKVKYKNHVVKDGYELDDIVKVDDTINIEKEEKVINQYIKIGDKFYSKVYHFIEEMNLPTRHDESWNVEVHCCDGTFYSENLYQYLLRITNKLKIYRHGKNKNNGKTEVWAYAMPKYYREKMFSDEIRHLCSCVVSEEHDKVYKEQYRQLQSIHPDWKDMEITVFIEKAEEESRHQRAEDLNRKMKEFYQKSKI